MSSEKQEKILIQGTTTECCFLKNFLNLTSKIEKSEVEIRKYIRKLYIYNQSMVQISY